MLSDNNFITLLVDSVDNFFEADAANFGKEYVVQGSLGINSGKRINRTFKPNRTQTRFFETVK
jgi:hypothetical protein